MKTIRLYPFGDIRREHRDGVDLYNEEDYPVLRIQSANLPKTLPPEKNELLLEAPVRALIQQNEIGWLVNVELPIITLPVIKLIIATLRDITHIDYQLVLNGRAGDAHPVARYRKENQ